MSFGPLETERLVIRRPEIGDAEALQLRRNRPDTARYQSWTLPFSLDEARRITAGAATMDGPTDDEWWMTTLVERATDTVIGDIAIHQSFQGRAAEIGYTLHPDHWGRGYGVEAVEAVIDALIDRGVRRLSASTHPDNLASIRLLERLGFRHEGRLVDAYFLDHETEEEISDEVLFGMTAAGRARWSSRPTDRPTAVRLIEIDASNHRAVARLETGYAQRDLVAPVPASFADALFPGSVDDRPVLPWLRAIEIDERDGDQVVPTLAGFVMLAHPNGPDQQPYLWRLLIDRWHQRRGIASAALDQIEGDLRSEGHRSIEVHWVPGPGSPEAFYRARGYEPTGRIEDGEIEASKPLNRD